MLRTMSDQLHIAQNAAYRFTYLWYVFKYWLCKDHLWTGDFETIIIVYLFIHLFVCLNYYIGFLEVS